MICPKRIPDTALELHSKQPLFISSSLLPIIMHLYKLYLIKVRGKLIRCSHSIKRNQIDLTDSDEVLKPELLYR